MNLLLTAGQQIARGGSSKLQTEIKHYDFIDALRGIGMLGVLMVHSSQYFEPSSIILKEICLAGQYGVQLFFIVSAFSLCLSVDYRVKREQNWLRTYFIRRFFRIAPAFYFAIVIYLIKDGFAPRYWAPDGISFFHVLTSVTFINGLLPTHFNAIFAGVWAISDIMLFYAVFPLLFTSITSIRRSIFLVLCTVVVGGLANLTAKYYLGHTQIPEQLITGFRYSWLPAQACVFSLGIFLFFLFKNLEKKEVLADVKKDMLSSLLILAGFTVIIGTLSWQHLPFKQFPISVGLLLISYALILRPHKLFVNRLTVFLGKVSYSAYLSHLLVLSLIMQIIKMVRPEVDLYGTFLVFFPVVVILTALISFIMRNFVEKPGREFGYDLVQKIVIKGVS